jgi:hypothetical protein
MTAPPRLNKSSSLGKSRRGRARRYRRHVTALKRAMARQRDYGPADQRASVQRLANTIVEDW